MLTFFICVVDVLLLCKLLEIIQAYLYFKKHGKEIVWEQSPDNDYGF